MLNIIVTKRRKIGIVLAFIVHKHYHLLPMKALIGKKYIFVGRRDFSMFSDYFFQEKLITSPMNRVLCWCTVFIALFFGAIEIFIQIYHFASFWWDL